MNNSIYYVDRGVLLEHFHTKLHPGPEWRIFHIVTSEDIDDVISCFFTAVCVWVVVCLDNKKNMLARRYEFYILVSRMIIHE